MLTLQQKMLMTMNNSLCLHETCGSQYSLSLRVWCMALGVIHKPYECVVSNQFVMDVRKGVGVSV